MSNEFEIHNAGGLVPIYQEVLAAAQQQAEADEEESEEAGQEESKA